MIRRLIRLLAATAVVSGGLLPLAAVNAGAIIDTDEIEAAAAGASCTNDDADCIAVAAAAPAIDLRGTDNVLNEDQTNFGNIEEGDTTEIEGDFTSVECNNNFTDSRSSGAAASGSLPNQNAGGIGIGTRCVGEADNAFLGDTSDNDTDLAFDDDICVVAEFDTGGGGFDPGDIVNCVQSPATVNNIEEEVVTGGGAPA